MGWGFWWSFSGICVGTTQVLEWSGKRGKQWEKALIEEPCNITLPVYSSWVKISAEISFFVCSVSFILSEISATGYCHSYWTKWPFDPTVMFIWVRQFGNVWPLFFVVCGQCFQFTVILRYKPFHLKSSSWKFRCAAILSLTLFPLPVSYTLHH